VSTLLERIGDKPESRSRTPDHGPDHGSDHRLDHRGQIYRRGHVNSHGIDTRQSNTPKDSPPPPVYIIRDLAAEIEAGEPEDGQRSREPNPDILVESLITHGQAISFIEMSVMMQISLICYLHRL
jgi:hypothetical protein